MPSEKHRSKEDTWGSKELSKSIKEATSDRSERKKHRDKDRDKERRKDRHSAREDERNDSADRKHRDKDRDRERRKERREDGEHRKDRDKDRDRDRDRDRDKDRERRERKERHRDKEEDSRDRHKEKDRHRDRDKHRDDDEEQRREERRRRKEEDGEGRERRRKHRDEEDGEDRERRRKHRDGDERDDKERRRKHRDKEDEGDDDRERRRREKERRHRDKNDEDRERRHRDDRDERDRDRHRDKDRDRERRHKERSEDDDEERRRRHEEKKRRKREEEEKRKEEERDEKERHRSRKHKEEPSVDEEEVQNDKHGVEVTMGDDDDDDAGYNYDDDEFEDYDDDFEDDDGDNDSEPQREMSAKDRELHELRKAIEAENMATLRSRQRDTDSSGVSPSSSDTSSSRPKTGRTGRTFVNFVAAKQRVISDKVSSKTKKRGKELMCLIDLDIASFDMFDLQPTKEYEMYIRSFGRSDTKQAYVQCNEDNIDRDIQTEEIEYRQKWTQFPADDMRGCGGGDDEVEDDEIAAYRAIKKDIDSARLVNFLQGAGQVITVLLEENLVDKGSGNLQSNQRQIVFSEGYTQLNPDLPFLKDRHVVHIEFHPIQTHLMLTAYSMPKVALSKDKLANTGLLCVWNINEPSRPQKVLTCQSAPLSCCFNPTKATLAFAGTADGSVVVWDLREPSSMHHTHSIKQEEWVIRMPTYSTDGVHGDENHHSPVTTVLAIVSPVESMKASLPKGAGVGNVSDETTGLSFQLASIEEQAIINFWTVVEITNPDKAGSESDLGLMPGGKVKLIKSSFVKLESPARDIKTKSSVRAFQMQLLPKDPNHLYVGTDLGCVIHTVRYGGKAPPKAFRSDLDVPVDIVTLDFSPFGLPVFVAGCVDGSLRLHSTTSEYPMVTWNNSTNGMAIVKVQWSRSRPSVFYVIDETAKVYIWDLLERDGSPVKIEQFAGGRLTTCSLSNDHSATGLGLPGRRPELAIAAESGMIEIHQLNDQFYKAAADELDSVASFLEKIM